MIGFVGYDIECFLKANSVKQVLRDEKDCAVEELSFAQEKPLREGKSNFLSARCKRLTFRRKSLPELGKRRSVHRKALPQRGKWHPQTNQKEGFR